MKKVFKTSFFYLVVLAMVLGNSVLSIDFSIPVAQANEENQGSIWTTRDDCGSESQDVNHYNAGDDVYINGKNFDDHSYDWRIKGKPGNASSDPDQIVASGTYSVDDSGSFCFNAYTVLDDDDGEYAVKFGEKRDNYRVDCLDENDNDICDVEEEPFCGDQVIEGEEECDGDAPQACTTLDGYAGTQTCNMPAPTVSVVQDVEYCVWNDCVTTEYCGDGIKNGLEQCDDHNTTSEDGCSATCQTETPPEPFCGDGNIDENLGEQCDDHNTTSEDGCSATCQTEPEENCQLTLTKSDEGYEPIAPGAEIVYHLTLTNTGDADCNGMWLKDYYDANTSYVSATLTPDINDSGYRVGWHFDTLTPGSSEEIDLTMLVDDETACDSTLTNTARFKLDGAETWNEITEQTAVVCKPSSECGNEKIEEGEQCDDGNVEDGDGCTANCTLENTYECEDITSQNGWYGQYFNYLSSHPDMDLPSGEWPDDGHGDPLGAWDTDWYDSEYFKFNRVDDNLMFGGTFFPMDFAAEETHNGHDYHFGIHWRAKVTPETAGDYDFSAISDDDLWVYLDGVLIAENAGIHAPSNINGIMALDGSHIVDIFFAERHVTQSHMSFEFADETLDIVPMPEECDVAVCGDQVIEDEEECDDGPNGSLFCTTECTIIEQPPICYVEGEPFFASTVESYDQGQKKDGSNVDANRSVPEQGLVLELGQNVSNFFSLGFGGWTIVSFDQVFVDGPGNDIKITEDTWGGGYPLETADVYVSQDGTTWAFLGTADNTNLNVIHTTSEFDLATTGLTWGQYIKVVDTSDLSDFAAYPTADGYDLNAVEALAGGYIGECEEVITVCKMDEEQNPLADWEMTLYGSNLIANGGFETPILSSGEWVIYSDASLTSWTVHSGDGLEIQNNAAGSPHGGNQLAELDSNNSSVISQTITTTVGERYKLKFWYSPRPNIGSGDNTIGVVVEGMDSETLLVNDIIGQTEAGGANTSWTLYEYNFVATDTATRIKFSDLGNSDSYGGYLDDIVLAVSGLTGDNGCVEFVNLPYDIYQVIETMQNGWTQVEPVEPNYFTVDFNEVNNNPTVTFVNRFDGEASCGDGYVNQESEQCDGDAPQACTTDSGYAGTRTCNMEPELTLAIQSVEPTYCVWNECVPTEYCGDETKNGNEQCDDGNTTSGDGCSAQCQTESGPTASCGDGTVNQTSEQCDDGNTTSGDGCSAQCQTEGGPAPYCGDEVVNQTSEQCDWDNPKVCTTEGGYAGTQTCNMPSEQTSEEIYCVWNSCVTDQSCGDGLLNGLEQCDDGNESNGDGCNSNCQIEQEPPCTNCGSGGGGGGGGPATFAIKNLETEASCTGVEMSWLTTAVSDTILDYGTVSGVYTEHINNDTNATGHELTLTGLLPNTTYYYQVRAISGTGTEIKVVEKSFTTPGAEQCGAVLGEKIENPLICDFLRPSGSHGQDSDVNGVVQYPDGSLLRDACNKSMPVYLIKDQKKWHIPNWKYLHDHYFGQRIYNVLTNVLNNYPDWTPQVLGVKYYADGTLLRGSNHKIYIIENGKKRHITSLEELLKYAGQEIINVSDDVLNQY